jgi:AhpD family alkylhydroperoxidase
MTFESLTPETAAGRSKDILTELTQRHGEVGAMVSTMAHSPAVLEGYLGLSKAMRRSKLSRAVSERISLAIQQRQGCEMCLGFHTAAAEAAGLSEDEILAARLGTSADPAAAEAIRFGMQIYSAPWSISNDDVDQLIKLGYSEREIADIVGIVALNVLTGAFNLATGVGVARRHA